MVSNFLMVFDGGGLVVFNLLTHGVGLTSQKRLQPLKSACKQQTFAGQMYEFYISEIIQCNININSIS